jgi:hypothetical protein
MAANAVENNIGEFMAGVVNNCNRCGQTLWDEETIPGAHQCKDGGSPIRAPSPKPKKTSSLSDYSLPELEAELDHRKRVAEIREQELRLQEGKKFLSLLPSLLAVAGKHSRTSCNDTNLSNSFQARCTRCFLLDAQQSQCWESKYYPELILRERF